MMRLTIGHKGFLLKNSQYCISDYSGEWNVRNILIFLILPLDRPNEPELRFVILSIPEA
jgi:hypothetical protein